MEQVYCPDIPGPERPNFPYRSCLTRATVGGCKRRHCPTGNEIRIRHDLPAVTPEPESRKFCGCGAEIFGKSYGKDLCKVCRAKDPDVKRIRRELKRRRNIRYYKRYLARQKAKTFSAQLSFDFAYGNHR